MNEHKDEKFFLVVGYGSMGRRRIRLASEIVSDAKFICIDSNPERQQQAVNDGHLAFATLREGIKEKPKAAFVCTSPGHHADIILQLLSAGIHVFTELNLTSDRYNLIEKYAKENDAKIFLSSTLVYKKQMRYLSESITGQKKPLTYSYHVGQYLPDWHPWESYKDFFVGKKETNGIREILAIQLPWMIKAFGEIKNVNVISRNCTDLEIKYPDCVIICLEHVNGNIGTFMVDVASRVATTHLEVIGEDLHIVWNGHNDDMFAWDSDIKELKQVRLYETEEHITGYSDNIAEEPYRDEVKEYINVIGGKSPEYGLTDDKIVLDWIDRIESFYEFKE